MINSNMLLLPSSGILTSQENMPQNRYSSTGIHEFCGRKITLAKSFVRYAISAAVCYPAQEIFSGLSAIISNPNALAGVCRKLDKHVLDLIESINGIPGYFDHFKKIIHSAVGCIDFVQVAADVDFFINAKFKKCNELTIAGHVAISAANLGGATLWLGEYGFIKLGKAAETIGNARIFSFAPKLLACTPVLRNFSKLQSIASSLGTVRVFSAVTKVSLGFVTMRALGIAYVFFAAESLVRLLQKGDHFHKKQAGLDLAKNLSELALDAMKIVGVTSVIGLGVTASLCMGLGVSSFLYRNNHTSELNPKAAV